MADVKYLLNGIVQTKESIFTGGTKREGVLYFVRTSEGTGKEGYLYLNGRKYGNAEEVRTELKNVLGELPSGQTIAEIFESINVSLGNLDERIENVEDSVISAQTRISNVEAKAEDNAAKIAADELKIDENASAIESANTRIDNVEDDVELVAEAVDILNADSGTTGSVDQKIAEAISKLPEDMFVESGRVETLSGKTYLVLVIKGGHEVWIPADKLVDTYTGDDYIQVKDYKISLNVDKVKEALAIEDLATKDELDEVTDKLNETISGLSAVQEEVESFEASAETKFTELEEKDAELEAKDATLENQINALNSILRITGDNVQTISDAQVNANMIKDVTENGGTAVLTDDVVVDKTITIE